jgi:hypothetical protein
MDDALARRSPKKVANKYSRLAFVVRGRTHWVRKTRFAELEAAIRGAVEDRATYFGMARIFPGSDGETSYSAAKKEASAE